MFRLLAVLLLIVIAVVGLGYYRGWFHVETDNTGDNHRITITTDQDKIKKDEESLKKQLPSGHPAKVGGTSP